MADFTLLPPTDYVDKLLSLAPRFRISSPYQRLDEADRLCAGLVFSAFASYMEASFESQSKIDQCRDAIEYFASSKDLDAQNLLVTEVFETFRQPERSKLLLLPNSRGLYDHWIVG